MENIGDNSQPQRIDVLALLSLILSALGAICLLPVIGSLTGIVLGHWSLIRIKRRNLGGRALALTGTILGYVGILLFGLLVAALVPAFRHAQQHARINADMNHVRQIGLGISLYASDYNGYLPPDLAVLGEYYMGGFGNVWVTPGSDTPVPQNEQDVRAGKTDYVYRGTTRSITTYYGEYGPDSVIIVHTRPGALAYNKVNIAFLDGHTESHPAPHGIEALADDQGWTFADQAPEDD